jgi:uncharacterized membrane protein
MPATQVFGWACLGGAVAAVVAFVLPVLSSSAIHQKLQFNRDGLIAMAIIVIALALIAGVVALIPHITTRGAALEYGLGVNGIIKGNSVSSFVSNGVARFRSQMDFDETKLQ